jgi:hypothetical protein
LVLFMQTFVETLIWERKNLFTILINQTQNIQIEISHRFETEIQSRFMFRSISKFEAWTFGCRNTVQFRLDIFLIHTLFSLFLSFSVSLFLSLFHATLPHLSQLYIHTLTHFLSHTRTHTHTHTHISFFMHRNYLKLCKIEIQNQYLKNIKFKNWNFITDYKILVQKSAKYWNLERENIFRIFLGKIFIFGF